MQIIYQMGRRTRPETPNTEIKPPRLRLPPLTAPSPPQPLPPNRRCPGLPNAGPNGTSRKSHIRSLGLPTQAITHPRRQSLARLKKPNPRRLGSLDHYRERPSALGTRRMAVEMT